MVDFDVILCMTWLSPNFAILDCNAKTVTLAKPGTDSLVWEGDYTSNPVRIITFLRAKKMVSKGFWRSWHISGMIPPNYLQFSRFR